MNPDSGRQWQMVARFIRAISLAVFLTTLLLGQSVAAGSSAQRGASELARKNFLHALAVMGETVKLCKRKAKVIDIPHWKQIGTGREALLLGIAYFNLKRDNVCTALAAKDLLLASKMFEFGSRHDLEKGPPNEFVNMVLDAWWKELEAEARYRSQVSPADQEKIERISGLQAPFNMIESWNASGN
jgi:hypothetical protein